MKEPVSLKLPLPPASLSPASEKLDSMLDIRDRGRCRWKVSKNVIVFNIICIRLFCNNHIYLVNCVNLERHMIVIIVNEAYITLKQQQTVILVPESEIEDHRSDRSSIKDKLTNISCLNPI